MSGAQAMAPYPAPKPRDRPLTLGAVADNPSGRGTRGLSPFEGNVRTFIEYVDPEVADKVAEGARVGGQDYFDTGGPQGLKARASYSGVGVERTDNYPAKARFKQSRHTGGRLFACVAARLQRNVQSGLRQEIGRLYGVEGYDFCVRPAKDCMIPLSQNLFARGDDGTHGGVGFYGGGGSPPGQLQRPIKVQGIPLRQHRPFIVRLGAPRKCLCPGGISSKKPGFWHPRQVG